MIADRAGWRWPRRVTVASGLLVAGMGSFALLGWILNLPAWPSLWSETIPMAPSSALLFVVIGAAVAARGRWPQADRLEKWAIPIGLLVTLTGLGLAITSSMGIYLKAEHLGITTLWTPAEAPTGHMSPLTAILFVTGGLSFGASLHWPVARRRLAGAAWWVGSLPLTVGLTLILAYLFGVEQLALIPRLPPAGLTSVSFFVLGIGLLALAGSVDRGTGTSSSGSEISFGAFLMIFGLLAVGVSTIGYLSYRNYEDRYREGIESQLLAVWQLKADELVDWRAERLGDAQVLYQNSAFSALVQRVLEQPEDEYTRRQLTAWLAKYPEAYAYQRVFLLDAEGIERLAAPEKGEPVEPHLVEGAAAAMRSGEITFLDFHRDERSGRVHLSFLVPVLDAQDRNRPIGTLILDVDPETYLYPFLKQWPTPSESAETILVRREGEEVVFLNELRFRRGTALNLRFPLSQADLPAAAAARGETGFMEGVDYRGVPAIAYIGSVPGSPWALVARMDTAEINAPMRARLRETIGIIALMLFGALTGIGLVWRQQRLRLYEARFEADRERAWLQDVIARSLNEIYVYDPETLRFIFANAGACRNLGYSLAELTELTPPDIDPAYSLAGFQALLGPAAQRRTGIAGIRDRASAQGRIGVSGRGASSTGAIRRARVLPGLQRGHHQRKRAEEALTTSEVRYRRLFEAARDGILILDADTGMVVNVNPFLVEMLGYSREQFLGKRIWELGVFKDIAANKANFLELQQKEYITFENLPLETAQGRLINVEFVSHVYRVRRQQGDPVQHPRHHRAQAGGKGAEGAVVA